MGTHIRHREKASLEATPRKKPTLREKVEILRRQALCAECSDRLSDIEFDHELPLELGGAHSVENLRALCPRCHKAKTAIDKRVIARARRLRGETGQRARRKCKGSRLKSRGFEKTLRKRMDGKVVSR